jgi:hypothetical protein
MNFGIAGMTQNPSKFIFADQTTYPSNSTYVNLQQGSWYQKHIYILAAKDAKQDIG